MTKKEKVIYVISFGIIGTNWITQQFVEAAKDSGKYQLTSVYSRHKETAEKFARKNGATETFDDLNQFFTDDKFSTIYIASPNSIHFEQAKMAINHDKNVIVEKPAFMNPDQMKEIQALLKQHPKVLYFEAARNIHTPNFHSIQDKIAQMKTIQGAEFTYSKYSSRYDKVLAGEEPNVFSLNYAGGALQDLGVYTVYDAVTLFGKPDSVAYYPQLVGTGVDGKGTAILKFQKFNVVLNFSKISNSYMTSEVYGLKDLIQMDDAGEIQQVNYIDENGKSTSIGHNSEQNPMLPEANDFARIIDDPDSQNNQRDYQRWLDLSVQVNNVLFELRKFANISFKGEK